jgi:hypothetical protein
MLTINDMSYRLSKMTYRPGWELGVYEGATEGNHLEIKATVEDSVNPGNQVALHIVSPIPPCREEKDFDLFVSWRLRRIEIHESMEWLKVNGECVIDPHRETADRDKL